MIITRNAFRWLRPTSLLILLVTATAANAAPAAADYFVSPDGNDNWTGRLADPGIIPSHYPEPTFIRSEGAFGSEERPEQRWSTLDNIDPRKTSFKETAGTGASWHWGANVWVLGNSNRRVSKIG